MLRLIEAAKKNKCVKNEKRGAEAPLLFLVKDRLRLLVNSLFDETVYTSINSYQAETQNNTSEQEFFKSGRMNCFINNPHAKEFAKSAHEE